MQVDLTAAGDVPGTLRRYAQERIGELDRHLGSPVRRVHVVLREESNPRIERPARAEGEIDLHGPIIRGHVAESTMRGAIDALAEHLERQVRRFGERRRAEQRRAAASPVGEWRHGDWSPSRPAFYPRPPDERQILRRNTFAVHPMSAAEAAEELEALDHDFYLFRESETGTDAVVYRRDDGQLGVIGPAGIGWAGRNEYGIVWEESRSTRPTVLGDAVAEMNELDHRFMLFVDSETGRGNVIYLRYDGHYGLIEPASDTG